MDNKFEVFDEAFDLTGLMFAYHTAQRGVDAAYEASMVSIPRSEFWSFGRDVHVGRPGIILMFQFLGRNSGRSDQRRPKWQRNRSWCFNSSVGILVVRTGLG